MAGRDERGNKVGVQATEEEAVATVDETDRQVKEPKRAGRWMAGGGSNGQKGVAGQAEEDWRLVERVSR